MSSHESNDAKPVICDSLVLKIKVQMVYFVTSNDIIMDQVKCTFAVRNFLLAADGSNRQCQLHMSCTQLEQQGVCTRIKSVCTWNVIHHVTIPHIVIGISLSTIDNDDGAILWER